LEYLIGLLTSEDFRQHCRSRTSGTTVLHLGKDAIPTWSAPLISSGEQEAYASVVRPLFARMDALRDEQERLMQTRAALLPELHWERLSLRDTRGVA
jgi:type I restriction enzyme S subunit